MIFGIVASGPSLRQWQVDHLVERAPVIATNGSFMALRRPGIVYGCDAGFWDAYARRVKVSGHECWTADVSAAQRHGLNHVRLKTGDGLCAAKNTVNSGANSGYQAINLAFHFGAKKIVLVGFDMQATSGRWHWHDDLKGVEGRDPGINRWPRKFPALAFDLRQWGVEVVNCSIETALTCFPRADLRDVI